MNYSLAKKFTFGSLMMFALPTTEQDFDAFFLQCFYKKLCACDLHDQCLLLKLMNASTCCHMSGKIGTAVLWRYRM